MVLQAHVLERELDMEMFDHDLMVQKAFIVVVAMATFEWAGRLEEFSRRRVVLDDRMKLYAILAHLLPR